MNPQDFNALLAILARIAIALEGKDKDVAADIVNRFNKRYLLTSALERYS